MREGYEVERFDKENMNNFRANMKYAQLSSTLTPTIEFVAAVGVSIILWYGGNSVINGSITAGSLVAFLTYAVNISNPIKRLSRVIGNIQKALAAAQRVFDVLDLPEVIKNAPDAKALPKVKGDVRFNDVSFAYNENEEVLSHVSFEVKPGEMIAFVGPSGAGKSTVASLLPRFYDATNGSITIDGQDIRKVTLDSLREQVGIVPQETVLFNGSVYDNILYGRLDATREEVEAAAKAANAHDFIMQLPNGYETMLGDRGMNISGGQRQRISIARALLKDAPIVLLDEATASLDVENETKIQAGISELVRNKTVLIIAHRMRTVANADKIVVLENGSVAEMGTPEELKKKNGIFARMVNRQVTNMN